VKLQHLFPQSLFARLALLLLSVFFILQASTVLTIADFFERHVVQILLANHSASIALSVKLLEEEQGEGRALLMKTLSKLPELSMQIVKDKPVIPQGDDKLSRFFTEHLKSALTDLTKRDKMPRELLAQVHAVIADNKSTQWESFIEKFFALWDVSGFFQTHVIIQLSDGAWLNIEYTGHAHQAHLVDMPFLGIMLQFLVLAALLLFMVHILVRPLHTLAKAADTFGASIRAPHCIIEEGPIEVRHAAKAFNTMRERISGVIEERERVFAALSHDLRTPLTRMRLRVEQVEQKKVREKLQEDVRNLQSIVETSIAFTQSERHAETLVHTDMQALLEAIVEDRRSMGEDVSLLGKELTLSAFIFPVAFRRCLENLLDNALFYGKTAIVSTSVHDEGTKKSILRIDIDDYGPGIEEGMLEKVFEPFFRMEKSRNRLTGGHGLGLSIAQSMARLHNASISLRNRPEGGLRARLDLPIIRRIIL